MLCFTSVGAQTHRGKASYYSKRATGARAANGERIHHDSLTCAHRSYPFGTLLKVKNLSNGREVVVRVTDRGPYGRNRIIDLSYGAARELGMLAQGTAMVEVKRVDGLNPPYRMDDEEGERGLPDFEFDINNVGFSFIDDWKEREESSPSTMVEKRLPTKAQAESRRRRIRAKAEGRLTEQAENRQAGAQRQKATAQRHVPVSQLQSAASAHLKSSVPGQTSSQKQESESSTWRNVFEKIKNWFGE